MKEGNHKGWEKFYASLGQLPERLKKPVPFVQEAVHLFKRLGVRVILDLGCGAGRHCVLLAKEGFETVGIDASCEGLKLAKAWLNLEGVETATVLRASTTGLPFRNECCQAVLSVSVMHHATREDVNRTTEEINRVLGDQGIFLANLLSVEDYRYGSGQEVEPGTYLVCEDFEEGQFKEFHHFFTREEVLEVFARFRRIHMEPIHSGTMKQTHCYWKVTATK